jgi:hypothetical protein
MWRPLQTPVFTQKYLHKTMPNASYVKKGLSCKNKPGVLVTIRIGEWDDLPLEFPHHRLSSLSPAHTAASQNCNSVRSKQSFFPDIPYRVSRSYSFSFETEENVSVSHFASSRKNYSEFIGGKCEHFAFRFEQKKNKVNLLS